MDERFIRAVDAIAFCFQLLTISGVWVAAAAIWALICHADADRCRVAWWQQKQKRDAERDERGFE